MAQAQYLVRFDDICPTMNWRVWSRIEPVLVENHIRPILAVVPDNRDPKLMVDAPCADFWEDVRKWQSRGWTIGLHGYQHVYTNHSAGMMRLTRQSEFAGLPQEQQEQKIQQGLDIFARNGVRADCWVAPSHSFDQNTVAVLARQSVKVISDGLWPWPHTDRSGITWVPQQLWDHLRLMPTGVWTACYHPNNWDGQHFDRFRRNIETFKAYVTSLPDVLNRFVGRQLALSDRARAEWDLIINHRLRGLAARVARYARP